ncbi:type II toxin-antitoxin system VapC family toxin [Metallosphaera hakonensis]|uniref:PIN domain-containing protein n=1 Tax=Metallosphaera hakonensis JCM 8857 = DSM 7519 TaxID=1293036 RepID=A0A2U9IRA2_9CREN|nr:type II toxin-antitoxin system VapC family toxin [Metallosphaera hakonensis]AWR98562.1 PIN domain-containing protein [Metallosphaera hakonensis JCM 8857 = DSM 7519]
MKKVVLDSGVVLSFLEGKFGDYYQRILNEELEPYISTMNLTEIYYVLCRKMGGEKAEKLMKMLVKSGLRIVGVKPRIMKYAAECKCHNSISMGDCFSIATAKYLKTTAVFKREKELEDKKIGNVEFID